MRSQAPPYTHQRMVLRHPGYVAAIWDTADWLGAPETARSRRSAGRGANPSARAIASALDRALGRIFEDAIVIGRLRSTAFCFVAG